jgi:hypothetical protein
MKREFCNESVSSSSSSICASDFYFDPLDGTFVKIDLDVDGSGECAGSLSEQGRRDSIALALALMFLCVLLLVLLVTSCQKTLH